MKYVLAFTIRIYQLILSPDHSAWARLGMMKNACLFYPTCSEYSMQVILKYGAYQGSKKAIKRIIRCNPKQIPAIDIP